MSKSERELLGHVERSTLMGVNVEASIEALIGERSRFIRMARARVATDADAEDVVHRAILRASERIATLQDPERTRAWFYRILRRTVADHHREPFRRAAVELSEDIAAAEDDAIRSGPVCCCALRMVDELRPAYAEVIRRIDHHGEAPAAVATSLGISTANLYVRLHRARHALRERIEGHCSVTSIEPCLECTCHTHGHCDPSE